MVFFRHTFSSQIDEFECIFEMKNNVQVHETSSEQFVVNSLWVILKDENSLATTSLSSYLPDSPITDDGKIEMKI